MPFLTLENEFFYGKPTQYNYANHMMVNIMAWKHVVFLKLAFIQKWKLNVWHRARATASFDQLKSKCRPALAWLSILNFWHFDQVPNSTMKKVHVFGGFEHKLHLYGLSCHRRSLSSDYPRRSAFSCIRSLYVLWCAWFTIYAIDTLFGNKSSTWA